jgi:hypothetical protein
MLRQKIEIRYNEVNSDWIISTHQNLKIFFQAKKTHSSLSYPFHTLKARDYSLALFLNQLRHKICTQNGTKF